MIETLREPQRDTPLIAEYEVLVLGGGPAGVAAACAAAHQGRKTGLIERYGFLGGMGTAAMVTNFCGLHASIDGEIARVVGGLSLEITNRLERLGAIRPINVLKNPSGGPHSATQAYDGSAYKIVLDQVVSSAQVDVRLHTFAVGARVENDRIDCVFVESKSGRGAIRANVFIDCSGDADLAYWAGETVEKGNDAGWMAYPTTMFRVGAVDDAVALTEAKPNLAALIDAFGAEYDLPRNSSAISCLPHDGEWLCNLTQISRDGEVIDGTEQADLAYAEIEGRRQVISYLSFLKDKAPGFENAYLLETGPQVGIRETRRLQGRKVLSGDDILNCASFEDRIGINGWPLEIHLKGRAKWVFLEGRGYHDIPFGSTVPNIVQNLFVAGRCASTTPDGQASVRVTGPCYVMGQAVGTAAAQVMKAKLSVQKTDIAHLQATLRDQGAFLSPDDI